MKPSVYREKPWKDEGTEVTCVLTGGMRFLVVSLRSWATLTGIVYPSLGGVSNRGHSAVKSVDIDTCIYRGIESGVIKVI